jgi:SagB-type dehydrogenase family enzyme
LRAGPRLVRNPDLLIGWGDEGLVVQDVRSGIRARVRVETVSLLDFFGRPRSAAEATRALDGLESSSVQRTVRRLVRLGLLLSEGEARRRVSRLKIWRSNLASASYHASCRDELYFQRPEALRKYLRRLAAAPRPPLFKRYKGRARRRLPQFGDADLSSAPLGEVLGRRRTVRLFSPGPVRFDDLAAVVGGTWGQTGWIIGEILGRLVIKTSPSAGALHPIECYVLAWKVRGLTAGLYHFDVAADELRLLRSGNFSTEAVRAASGQRWIRGAAFLCVMTAVFTRTLWKYRAESAYRNLYLDAGHLAQTFCLIATARGLGPFTTAAIQHSYIESLIGLDGVKEFPIYLCGAGVPAEPLRSPRGS